MSICALFPCFSFITVITAYVTRPAPARERETSALAEIEIVQTTSREFEKIPIANHNTIMPNTTRFMGREPIYGREHVHKSERCTTQ